MEIELVNPQKDLIPIYKMEVEKFINLKLITLEEWNSRFKNFRDEYGYSFIHYLESTINELDTFITNNPVMLENRKELEKRFGVKIRTPGELLIVLQDKDENSNS